MRALLDVNVLVAVLDPEHVKHVAAYDWFGENLATGWASCPLTENACLRVMTNPRYPNPKSPAETLARLERSKGQRQPCVLAGRPFHHGPGSVRLVTL